MGEGACGPILPPSPREFAHMLPWSEEDGLVMRGAVRYSAMCPASPLESRTRHLGSLSSQPRRPGSLGDHRLTWQYLLDPLPRVLDNDGPCSPRGLTVEFAGARGRRGRLPCSVGARQAAVVPAPKSTGRPCRMWHALSVVDPAGALFSIVLWFFGETAASAIVSRSSAMASAPDTPRISRSR